MPVCTARVLVCTARTHSRGINTCRKLTICASAAQSLPTNPCSQTHSQEEEFCHGIDPAYFADNFVTRSGTGMAVQPKLGLWTKRRRGTDCTDCNHSLGTARVLTLYASFENDNEQPARSVFDFRLSLNSHCANARAAGSRACRARTAARRRGTHDRRERSASAEVGRAAFCVDVHSKNQELDRHRSWPQRQVHSDRTSGQRCPLSRSGF